jgi:hypothetical protein
MWKFGTVLLTALFPFLSLSQKFSGKDSITDSLKIHSVKKAVVLSASLPGLGQIYNHKAMPQGRKKAFWKVPLIYAGLGTSAFFLIQNQITQSNIKKEYNNRISGGILDPKWDPYDNQALVTLQKQFLNNRDLSMLLFFAIYGLQIADAGIEAHFVNFDISDDISCVFKPKLFTSNSVGLSLQFKFH